MKKKIFSVFFALVLICSFSLVTVVPAGAVAQSTFTVANGTYTTVKVDDQNGTISASLPGGWDSAVIGEFTATGEGGLYVVEQPEWGTTANIVVTATLDTGQITFSGTAEWISGDDISDDEVTGIAGTIIIESDGNVVADLTGDIEGGYHVDIDIIGSMVPVADLGVEITSTNVEGPYSVGVEQGFSIRTTSDDSHAPVLFKFVVEGAELADIESFEYYDAITKGWVSPGTNPSGGTDTWLDIMPVFSEVSGNLEGYFGPLGGFPMAAGYDVTTLFKINFATAKTYPVTISLDTVGGEITATSFEVVAQPHENTIASSTMIFEGELTDAGDGIYTGVIPMVDELFNQLGDFVAGFDVYAEEGGTAYVQGMEPDNWIIGSDHDAYSESGPWGSWYDPDCADWDKFFLELTADHWYLRYASTGESPMSGTMYWYGDGTGYAWETDPGTVRNDDGSNPTDPLNRDATRYTAGSAQEWGWHCGWGEERIPLELPGFAVQVTPGDSYTVTLTPAVRGSGPVVNDTTDINYGTIQLAIDAPETLDGHTINVAAGEYAGAIVDKDVTVSGVEGGASVITSGVQYRAGNDNLQTAFRPETDGAEIRNFTINCGEDPDLAVYARGVDNVTVDFLVINTDGTVQGITNWGGSGWEITNNVITNTVTLDGGGIGIFLGAMPPTKYSESTELRVCTGNLIQLNKIAATATAETYSCAGIAVCLDTRYEGYENLDGSEDVSGNQILDNIITSTGVNNAVGIEVGAILGDGINDPDRTDPVLIAAIMAAGAVHDNLVQDNSIDGADTGIYFYNVTGLTVTQNEIANCIVNGIYVEHGHSGVAVNYNSICGNAFGLENDDTDVDYGSIDATYNWWGDVAGPETVGVPPHNPYTNFTEGDSVSDYVDYLPWLIQIELVEGWNILSDAIALDEACLPQLDAALTEETVDVAYYFDSSTQDWYNIPEDASLMDAWYIKMLEPVTVNIWASSEATFPWQKEMKVGWNFVGLAELYEMEASEALLDAYWGTGVATDLTGYTKVISPSLNGESWTYLRETTPNPMPTMVPTKGYWVFMVNDGVLGGFSSTPIVEVEEPLPGP